MLISLNILESCHFCVYVFQETCYGLVALFNHLRYIWFYHLGGVVSWMTHYATSREVAGSFPSDVLKNSVAFSPQANYTDWSTAAGQQTLVPTFVDRGVSRGQHGGTPTAVNLSFLDRSRYFYFKYLLIYAHKGSVDPIPHPLLWRKFGGVGNRTPDL
jgi:hypothetical protein